MDQSFTTNAAFPFSAHRLLSCTRKTQLLNN